MRVARVAGEATFLRQNLTLAILAEGFPATGWDETHYFTGGSSRLWNFKSSCSAASTMLFSLAFYFIANFTLCSAVHSTRLLRPSIMAPWHIRPPRNCASQITIASLNYG